MMTSWLGVGTGFEPNWLLGPVMAQKDCNPKSILLRRLRAGNSALLIGNDTLEKELCKLDIELLLNWMESNFALDEFQIEEWLGTLSKLVAMDPIPYSVKVQQFLMNHRRLQRTLKSYFSKKPPKDDITAFDCFMLLWSIGPDELLVVYQDIIVKICRILDKMHDSNHLLAEIPLVCCIINEILKCRTANKFLQNFSEEGSRLIKALALVHQALKTQEHVGRFQSLLCDSLISISSYKHYTGLLDPFNGLELCETLTLEDDHLSAFLNALREALSEVEPLKIVKKLSIACLELYNDDLAGMSTELCRTLGMSSPGTFGSLFKHPLSSLLAFCITGLEEESVKVLFSVGNYYNMLLYKSPLEEASTNSLTDPSTISITKALFLFNTVTNSLEADCNDINISELRVKGSQSCLDLDSVEPLFFLIDLFCEPSYFGKAEEFLEQLTNFCSSLSWPNLSSVFAEYISGALFYLSYSMASSTRKSIEIWTRKELRFARLLIRILTLDPKFSSLVQYIFDTLGTKSITGSVIVEFNGLLNDFKSQTDPSIESLPRTFFGHYDPLEVNFRNTHPAPQYFYPLPKQFTRINFRSLEVFLKVMITSYGKNSLKSGGFEDKVLLDTLMQETIHAIDLEQSSAASHDIFQDFDESWQSFLTQYRASRLRLTSTQKLGDFPGTSSAQLRSLIERLQNGSIELQALSKAIDILIDPSNCRIKLLGFLGAIDIAPSRATSEALVMVAEIIIVISSLLPANLSLEFSTLLDEIFHSPFDQLSLWVRSLICAHQHLAALQISDLIGRKTLNSLDNFNHEILINMGLFESAAGYQNIGSCILSSLERKDCLRPSRIDLDFLQTWGFDTDLYFQGKASCPQIEPSLISSKERFFDLKIYTKSLPSSQVETIADFLAPWALVYPESASCLKAISLLKRAKSSNEAFDTFFGSFHLDLDPQGWLTPFCQAYYLGRCRQYHQQAHTLYQTAITLAPPPLKLNIYRKFVGFMTESRSFSDAKVQDAFKSCFAINDSDPKVLISYANYLEEMDEKIGSPARSYASMKAYTKVLLASEAYNQFASCKFLSIWFTFEDKYADNVEWIQKIQDLTSKVARKASIAKFITSISQLSSRLCNCQSLSGQILQIFLVRLFQDFPHTVIWKCLNFILSLIPSRREKFGFLQILTKSSTGLRELWDDYLAFARALATISDVGKGKESTVFISKVAPKIHTLHYGSVVAPSSEVIYRISGSIKTSTKILKLDDRIEVFHSMQRPKKIKAICADGTQRSFLIKPKDDMRKDMMLLDLAFSVNNLISKKAARKGNILTYSAVPLNEEVGVVEWVDRTLSLRAVLRELYSAVNININYPEFRDLQKNTPDFHAVFLETILPKFPPQLFKWFYRRFLSPASWLSARMSFVRSAAQMSIFGHLMGLGDRHCENILMLDTDGTLLHVDFSCIFEKGRLLAVPERVPFRLTQNIVNSMGSCGWKGDFLSDSVEVLRVLRGAKQLICAILSVVVSDPIAEFGKSLPVGLEIMKCIRNKLSGIEDVSFFDTERGQVEYLIGAAISPENLSKIHMILTIIGIEGLPLLSGSFYGEYTIQQHGKSLHRGRTVTSNISNSSIFWNEAINMGKLSLTHGELLVLAVKVMQDESQTQIGGAKISFTPVDSFDASVLLENSKVNASIKISQADNLSETPADLAPVRSPFADSALWHESCSSTEASEDEKIVKEIFQMSRNSFDKEGAM